MRRVIASVLFVFLIPVVPATSDALTVQIGDQPAGFLTTTTVINGKVSIQIAPAVGAGSTTYAQGGASFSLSTCSRLEGCSGYPARVFISEGASLDSLVLTDVKVTTTGGGTLGITSQSGPTDFSALSAGLTYPFGLSIAGLFSSKSDSLAATANGNGALINLAAPSFSSALSASFNKQATSSSTLFCGEFESSTCAPFLQGAMTLNFAANTTVRLTGSGGMAILFSRLTEENGGVAVLANALADLQPDVKVFRASLEPSPGAPSVIMFRGVPNSTSGWIVDREGNGASKTRVEISIGGVVKVKADGLCDATLGCTAMNVDLSVACTESGITTYPGVLALDQKGNGETIVPLPTPCTDPAAFIETGGVWIAVPAVP